MADHPGGREDRPLRLRGHRPAARRPDRPDDGDRQRGAVLGRRGHRHGDHGHESRRRLDLRLRHARADGRVHPAVLRHASTSRRSPPSASPSPTPAPTSRPCARPRSTTRPSDEWVLNGQKAWATNGGIAKIHVIVASVDRDARLARPGRLRHPARHARADAGHEGPQARPARLAHRRRLPRRLPRPRPLPARRQGEARRPARPRARGQPLEVAGRDADLRGQPARPSARRRSASPARPTSTRSTTPRSASSSAARSSRTRPSPSRSPT